MSGIGDGSLTVNLADLGLERAQARDLLRGTARTVVVLWGDHVVSAGFIETPAYSRDAGTVTVNTKEIRAIFRERLTFGVELYELGDLTITNRSAAGAVHAILTRGLQGGNPEWTLPLDLPGDGAGDISFQWKNYQALTIEDCLKEVEKLGYEVDFEPYLSAGSLRWRVRVAAKIQDGSVDLPVSVDDSPVSGLTVTEDGSSLLTGVFVAGNGSEVDMITAWAGEGGPTTPIRDAWRSAKDITDPEALQKFADAQLALYRNPVVTWKFDVSASVVDPSEVAPGRLAYMDVRGDPWVVDGRREGRIISLSGDISSLTMTPEVQLS